ncbi:BLOC-2 complex member HPS6 [Heterodontus francisci]|uniref:BLOC-2 complex member HPS6 n=1 Tax=Heterodontus francisci TaxID=7792 RepID=UPI00355C05C9
MACAGGVIDVASDPETALIGKGAIDPAREAGERRRGERPGSGARGPVRQAGMRRSPSPSPLRRLSDLSLYSRHQQLRELLRPDPGPGAHSPARLHCCSRRRLYLYLPRERRLLSFDRSPARGPAPAPLDRSFPGTERLLEVLELWERPRLEGPATPGLGLGPAAALITQRGKAEFWSCREAGGWQLLQAAELCSSPRARVLSAAWDGRFITWCEERPPASGRAASQQHCVCSRSLDPGHSGLALGPVRILMHNSPAYRVLAAGEAVYLVPGNDPSNCPMPSNSPSNCPMPSNSPSNYPMPSNSPSNCPMPSNSPSNCPMPGNSPSNCPMPSNSPSNCPMPGNSPSNCPMPSNSPSNYPMPSNSPSNCPMPSNSPSNCPMPGNSPSNCPMPSNNPGNCPMPSNSPSNCPMPSNSPSNCPMPGNNPSNCPMPGNSPSNCPLPGNSPMPSNSPSSCPMSNLAKFILVWGPREDTLTISSLARGPLDTKKLLPRDSDFRRLVADAAGLLPALLPLDIRAVSPCPAGLLLALANGEVSLLLSDGTTRLLCQLSRSPLAEDSLMMELCGTTLICTLGRTLQCFDTETGRMVEETALEVQPLALLACRETGVIQLLAEDGIYALGLLPGHSDTTSGIRWGKSQPREVLEQLVLEEACKYYQKRSLSSSRLTVEKLKSEAMFQAPLALCSILQNHLNLRKTGYCNQQTYTKLHNIMAGEVQGYVNLEEAKSCIINGSENEVTTYVEEITEQEIRRLLHCQLDREALVYLNSIFNMFPREAWKAVKRTLHLHQNSDGLLSARATADMWRVILSPGLPSDQQVTTNGVVAVFELICRLLYQFHPKWLPKFVELTQQHLATCRNYGSSEGPENAPLYKRAMSVIPPARSGGTGDAMETAIELLLCSKRPNAIIQAVRILIERRMWQRAVEATQRFSQQGPLLKKELFATMLVQISQHRALDPYLEEIWELCPEDATTADVLDIVLRSVPSLSCEPEPYTSDGRQLTIGPLRSLLAKVLRRGEDRRSADMTEGLKTLVFPPPTPPRQKKVAAQSDPLNSEPSAEANEPL